MAQNSADADSLSELLAEESDLTAEEIEQAAGELEIENPETARSEPLDEDWEDSPAYQQY